MALSDRARQYLHYGLTSLPVATEVADRIDASALANQIGSIHASILAPSHRGSKGGTSEPTPVQIGAALGDAYTLGTDQGYQVFKIPSSYAGNLKTHIHWSKSDDLNESGKNVRWQVSYLIASGNGANLNTSPTIVNIDGTYADTGLTSRICYRSADYALSGAVAGYYLYIQVMAVTPTGTAMASEPLLLSLDISYDSYLNR